MKTTLRPLTTALRIALLVACANGLGFSQAITTLHINEIESNGGVPDDWVELTNTGTTAIDVSGWKIKDNDDTHPFFVLPAGSIIQPGGYLAADVAVTFGLGAADSVRLYTPAEVLYESYSWTAHAVTTYGRCPDGIGPFVTTTSSTKGAKNDCSSPVKINEIESNGGVPDDWVELYNPSTIPASIGGFVFKDNDDTHNYTIPAGTILQPGAYLVLNTVVGGVGDFNFGLGSADAARLFDTTGALVDSYSWTAHAGVTYGRCPNGTGPFVDTHSSTKGAANDCGTVAPPTVSVKINEVESDGGVPGDWVELINTGTTPANIGGFIFRDNDDTHSYTIPAGTIIAPGGFFVLDEASFVFGLGSADSARLFDTTNTLVDSYTWTAHAITTYGRCPDGTGDFTTTTASTKGTANGCVAFSTWPGGADVQTADGLNVFGTNLSGLIYEGSKATNNAVLWGVRNGPSTIFRLIFNGSIWIPDPTSSWGAGKTIVYPSGTGGPDSEGITFAGSSGNGLYVSTERDNNNNGVSFIEILRFDPSAAGSTLTATHEWNLTPDLPVTGPNLGAEGITYVSDTQLVASGFFDEAKNHVYNPAEYPNHGSGLFFITIESTGIVYAYALDHSGNKAFTRIATIVTGLPAAMDLQLDNTTGDFWVVCDDTCQGHTVVLRINAAGKFTPVGGFQRPANMPNLNNEGFAMAPGSECSGGFRPVFWSDDTNDDNHAIRSGTLSCTAVVQVTDTIAPKAFPTSAPAPNAAGWNAADVTVTWNWADNLGGSGIDPANCPATKLSSGEGTLTVTSTCKDKSGNTGSASLQVKVDKSNPTISASAKNADNSAYTFGSWTNQTVTVHYNCADAVSGVATCTADQVFSADGSVSTSGTATDNAGRTANSNFVSVMLDKTAPSVSITTPTNTTYDNTTQLKIDWTASDAGSGIASVVATLDGKTITKGQVVDLLTQSLGSHSVLVKVTDNAGNTASSSVTFSIGVTVDSLDASIDRLTDSGDIGNKGIANSLHAKLGKNPNQLNAFLNELDAQQGKKLDQTAYDILKAGASYLIAHP